MKKRSTILFYFFTVMVTMSCGDQKTTENPRQALLFDSDWRFQLNAVPKGQVPDFDDSDWRKIDLPHDWSIEDNPGLDSPLDSTAIGGIDYGYLTGGTAWYRKHFRLPATAKGKKISLLFEGVYMNADTWINGNHLGNHPYGYTSYSYDITDLVNTNDENVVAVEVKNEGRSSRWYPGSGIYRHVWLHITDPIHVATWGTSITTPEVSNSSATVVVENVIKNESGEAAKLQVISTIIDASGNTIQSVTSDQTVENDALIHQEFALSNPALWSVDDPNLYTAITEISENGQLKDRVVSDFGIRQIEFTTEGFFLNGKNLLMKGGCMHHGNGPLGAAAYDRAEERRVELMKANGFNAIRCAHNPPSPAFLKACDKLGVLVIDEYSDMWRQAKNPQDYHLYFDDWWKKDLESMVLRDRNHPSIVMWSIGNEIPERATPEGAETANMLASHIRQLDPTRPVTSAVNGLNPDKDPYFATLDVAGYNYAAGGDHGAETKYMEDHARVPERIIYGAETYPLEAFDSWMQTLEYPYVFGDFVWTSFDYLGEASIGWLGYPHDRNFYPWNHAYCGDIDICGFKRPQSYYRDVLWQHEDGVPVSIFVKPPQPTFAMSRPRASWSKWHWHDLVSHWNWSDEQKPLEVVVYSMYPEVELFLNGTTLGKKPTNRENEFTATFEVPYAEGELKAVAYDGEIERSTYQLNTAKEPTKITLLADRSTIDANGQDLSYITVELQDDQGVRNQTVEQEIHFELEGPGKIIAVGSSNPMSKESYQQSKRKTYEGRCLVIVKAGETAGEIKLKASVEGFPSTTIVLTSE